MFDTSRRRMLGASMLGAGTVLAGLGASATAKTLKTKGNIMLDRIPDLPKGLSEAVEFPLIEAIHGRRSRRFARGAAIPGGPLAYASKHQPQPLSELEQMMLLTTVAGNTGWSNLIPYNRNYLPNIPNYAGAAGGRTFPSAAGFQITEFFYTDDNGVYFLPTRDMPAVEAKAANGETDLNAYLDAHRSRIVKIADGRLATPARPEHMEMHNDWCVNIPGSTLIIPVADLAQHIIQGLCYFVQNGVCIYDDVNNRPIPGLEKYKHLVDIENPYPFSYVEQVSATEVTVELSCACYAGALMLQAMGLGGWMFNGLNPFSILGASGDPEVPGLGFRYDMIEGEPLPHVTGLDGVFEGHTQPHFKDMRAAVESVVRRKFGSGGPFNEGTKGPYKETDAVRRKGAPINDEFIDCVAHMAQYIQDTFGRFPAKVPAMLTLMYLQAHKLDTDFYDEHFEPGAYLRTHAQNSRNW
ncbi:hypothetical protein P7228_09870 [Altererythrobacter arenosus]|uniref:Uncharacterized protein n=1 Tax=Altererythrobacter arenosus TaxID=3032592 RepID=A0ABY8FMQ2_9SPHN|nr:hypothetical protein [Altererythrobacter sp. CAU 1644]WFL76305.1 hypothetical protein P7228_09870 [Altererythrobacter sp. CAU 1644]